MGFSIHQKHQNSVKLWRQEALVRNIALENQAKNHSDGT